jgi:hypothetical protein
MPRSGTSQRSDGGLRGWDPANRLVHPRRAGIPGRLPFLLRNRSELAPARLLQRGAHRRPLPGRPMVRVLRGQNACTGDRGCHVGGCSSEVCSAQPDVRTAPGKRRLRLRRRNVPLVFLISAALKRKAKRTERPQSARRVMAVALRCNNCGVAQCPQRFFVGRPADQREWRLAEPKRSGISLALRTATCNGRDRWFSKGGRP